MICDLILKGEIHAIKEIMEKSENIGMRTFDGALYYLYKEGRITLEEALRNADSPNNLRLRIDLEEKGSHLKEKETGLSLADEDDTSGLSLE